jgi:TonB family protein
MALRCLLFSSDEGTAQPVRQVLADLGIEVEYCAAAVEAVAMVTSHPFQILIVDWDNQPEAGFLLNTARERKASERPLALAVVAQDSNVPEALQAGANSVLRKPLLVNQIRETLTTARDLLRSRLDSVAPAQAAAAAAGVSSGVTTPAPIHNARSPEKMLRAGEFLQPVTAPGAQFDTESEVRNSIVRIAASEIDPLKDLEPMAASVDTPEVAPEAPAPASSEPRGLAWYLNARAGTLPSIPLQPAPPQPPPPPPVTTKDELLSFDQTPVQAQSAVSAAEVTGLGAAAVKKAPAVKEQKDEAALFAYMAGESKADPEPESAPTNPWVRKGIFVAALIAVCGVAYVKVPRSLWRQNIGILVSQVFHAGHSWLNPQAPTPVQAPASHENFGRAGDEYKLPVAETIPDATTDPSQIRVVPVIDPTVKQPNPPVANGQPPTDTSYNPNTGEQPQATPAPEQENSPSQPAPANAQGPGNATTSPTTQTPAATLVVSPAHPDTSPEAMAPPPKTEVQPVVHASPPRSLTTPNPGIPSSLKSQMASMTPEASGNKPAEAALPSIEPVVLPENSARALLLQEAPPAYPEAARGQKGTVVLQVLIGRDGTVQDAKFQQGSLAFARAAIEAVKQWRFKPYVMNGRPASTQTTLTLNFKPTS